MAIRGYIASSIDGYIADKDGGVSWLDPFQSADCGFISFMNEIKIVIMGRKTYEDSMLLGNGWPYQNKTGYVITSTPIENPPEGVTAWHDGVEDLISHLKQTVKGDIWLVGGAQLQSKFMELDALDRLQVFVIPVFLGGGTPLHQSAKPPIKAKLTRQRTCDLGIVELDYQL